MKTFDAVVIGAGIVGAACADRLTAEGLSVAIVERRHIAAGATSSGMGHIVVMDDSEAQLRLTSLSRELWRDLAPQLPAEAEYEKCGTIWVAENEDDMAAAGRKQGVFEKAGVRSHLLGSVELSQLEPNLRPGLAGALHVEDDGVVYQLCASHWLIERSVSKGGQRFIGNGVESVIGRTLHLSNGDDISGGVIINASGGWAKQFTPELKIDSKKGHLVITDRYPKFVSHQIVELGYLKSAHFSRGESVAFNIQPRSTGQVLLGSSRQPGIDDDVIDRGIVKRMLERAFKFMPGLSEMSAVRIWSGLRPATPDNLPYIGRSITNPDVIVAAGHEGLGITTSLGTAELVADEIFERESRIPRGPYSPFRFEGSNGES